MDNLIFLNPLMMSAFYLIGNISTSAAATVSSMSVASQATAGNVRAVTGYGQGTQKPLALSASELAQREAMLQRVHLPLAPLPADSSSSGNAIAVAPTNVQNSITQTQPQASIRDGVHDIGVHNSSLIDSPSVASDGVDVLATWNFYAGISTNGGANWTYINPKALFPNSYGGWCCESVATYEPSRDIFIWNLLYAPNADGGAFRLAVANGVSGLASASFHSWDLTPQQTGGARGDFYDSPVISVSSNGAYLQANVYHPGTRFSYRTVVMRFALNDLAANGNLNYLFFNTPGVASVTFTNGATTTMYFAGHLSASALRMFTWPESSATITWNDIVHVSFPTNAFSCSRPGVANSNWCGEADSRPLSGWVSNGVIGFSWNASQGKWGFPGVAPYPYTDIVRINELTKTHIDDPVVWNSRYAFMYMSFYPNATGDVGGMFLFGGGSLFEDSGVNIWDAQGRDFAITAASNHDVPVGGDYLTAQPLGNQWAGTAYVVLSNGVHPYYVTFGR